MSSNTCQKTCFSCKLKNIKASKSPAGRTEWGDIFAEVETQAEISEVRTPYVFFIAEPFDFQPEEANFHRMILQAEEQSSAQVQFYNKMANFGWAYFGLQVNDCIK